MKRIYIENTGPVAKFIGGKLLQPGEGREFDQVDVPAEHRPAAAPATEEAPDALQPLKELLEKSIKAITPDLPALAAEQLQQLRALEEADQNRKGVLEAIAAEVLRRANEQIEAEEAERLQAALQTAREELSAALQVLDALGPLATEQQRTEAESAVAEAQAKVDALTPSE